MRWTTGQTRRISTIVDFFLPLRRPRRKKMISSTVPTMAPAAVPPEAGVVTNDLDLLVDELVRLIGDPERSAALGKAAREHALACYGLRRFLDDWDALLGEVAA